MRNLENFIHSKNTGLTRIMNIAVARHQFETIHPFLDGNGRIGRLMIALYIIEKDLRSKPALYLSDFIEENAIGSLCTASMMDLLKR